MSGQPWYRHNPRDFLDGIVGMGPDLIGAYIVTLDLIYARGGPIPNDQRWLGGIMGCSPRAATSLVNRLLDGGKLSLSDGFLTNARATAELEKSAEMARNQAESGAKGGRKSAEKGTAKSENNELGQGSLKPKEEIREEKKEPIADAMDGQPSQDANSIADPIDLKALLFSTGKPYLIRNGVSPANAGSIIGKWRQAYGDGAVIDALALAEAEACSAPIPFITKILESRNGRNGSRPVGGNGQGTLPGQSRPGTVAWNAGLNLIERAVAAQQARDRRADSEADRRVEHPVLRLASR